MRIVYKGTLQVQVYKESYDFPDDSLSSSGGVEPDLLSVGIRLYCFNVLMIIVSESCL